jgi:uncharacterized coiled-coil DUF342 family protein
VNWLVLRLHRLHVEKFGPITGDLTAWFRAIKTYSESNKELRAQIRRMKEEGRAFNAEVLRLQAEYSELKARALRLEKEIDERLRG